FLIIHLNVTTLIIHQLILPSGVLFLHSQCFEPEALCDPLKQLLPIRWRNHGVQCCLASPANDGNCGGIHGYRT
ncbi:Os08g0484450, partial [Oryza sativa Japonica Group]